MILRIIFLVCAFLSLVCFGFAIRVKRKNIGFLAYSMLLFGCDMVCFFLLGSTGIASARTSLSIYYILYSWFYFSALWLVLKMSAVKKMNFLLIPSALISLYQTAIILSGFFGFHVMNYSKHVMFGGVWWIAEKDGGNFFFSFGTYRGLLFWNCIMIVATAVVGCVHLAKAFRNKFYLIIAYEVFYSIIDFLAQKYYWPVWITCLMCTPVCILALYIVNYYPDRKLRDWSLTKFANNMSDGFMLYNEYDDPIYMNDVLKNMLSKEFIDWLMDKRNTDGWIGSTVNIEGIDVVMCGNEEREFYFKANKIVIDEKGHFLGTIYMLHNTTDSILRLGAMQEINNELERAAKMKSDFLANMSHEIRTPMNAVIGMAELALRENLPETVTDYLKQIQSSGKNLLNIINDILDFSKIEAGKMDIFPDKYEPLSEINDIANILVNRIGDKKLELFVLGDTNIPNVLYGDAMRIRQVIINLANNAIKFTQKGMVKITVSCIKISDEEVMMTYHVIDTGQGIKEENLKKLFQSFQQVDSKRNRLVEGTGLGLAISKRLCEAMGGSIGVESTYGVGSDFHFSIPQKVIDSRPALFLNDAENIHAFVLNDNPELVQLFIDDIKKLGAHGECLRTLNEYKPAGENDFVFFIEEMFGEDIVKFLGDNPKVTGVILVDFDSDFETKIPNLRIMRRPQTTLNIVMVLSGMKIKSVSKESEEFRIDFKTPDAKFLIVDDNEINIKIAKGLIDPLGALCVGAISGKEAIEKAGKDKFDIIFMDHMMPEMDGIETTHLIRDTVPGYEDVPIIALTANVMEGVKEMFIREGMNDFIAKPVYVRELVGAIKKWLPTEKQISLSDDEIEEISESDEEAGELFDCLDNDKSIEAVGSASLFKKIVAEYYRVSEDKILELRKDFGMEDWENYTICIHSLKSSSRQIGAFDLGEMAWELEKAGKDGNIDYIQQNNEKFIAEYRILIDKLSKYFPDEKKDDKELPIIEIPKLKELLNELSQACEELDMDRMEEIKNEMSAFAMPEETAGNVKRLYKTIDDIDTDQCEDLIEIILALLD